MTIRVTIKDRDALQAIGLENLKAYITSKGWYKKDDYKKMLTDGSAVKVAELWGQASDSKVIVLPTKEEFADYTARMAENMMSLERAEDRSQLDIYVDITRIPIEINPTAVEKPKVKAVEKSEKPAKKKKVASKKR